MSFMFEVFYPPPANPTRETELTQRAASFGGRLDFREDAKDKTLGGICLTFEFDNLELASQAADLLRQAGEHVEGPVDYGS